jgi:hypothetical protein
MLIKKGREVVLVGKMIKVDREQWRGCVSKVPYRTEGRARKVARRASKRTGEDIRHYKCDFCAGWHCGHPRKIKEKNEGSSL